MIDRCIATEAANALRIEQPSSVRMGMVIDSRSLAAATGPFGLSPSIDDFPTQQRPPSRGRYRWH